MTPKNKISLFFVLSLFFICTFFISAPTFVSTDLGQKVALYLLNKKIAGKIQAEKVSLSWFGNQKVCGLQWLNQKEGVFFRCEEITTSVSLWKLFFDHDLGQLKITSPHLELDAAFSPNCFGISLATDSRKGRPLECSFTPNISINKAFYGTIAIDQGTLLVFSKNKLLASFQKVASHIHLPEEKFPIQLALIGQTEQKGEIGKFDIKAEISSFQIDQPNLEVQAKLVHFPIYGIDEILSVFDPSLKGCLMDGIGPSFDLDLEAKFQPQAQELYLLAQSPLIHAEIEAESIDGKLTLKNPARLNFSLPSSLFQNVGGFSLKNSPEVAIQIEKLFLPYGLNLKNIGFQTDIKVFSLELCANETNERIHIEGSTVSLSSNRLEKEIQFLASSSLKMGNLNSQILLKAQLQDPFLKTVQGNCKLQVQEFPLKIAELIFNEKLIPYFGSWFEGVCTLNINSQSSLLTCKAATPLLKISEARVCIDDNISLLEPILATYHSSPRLSPIQLSVNHCAFPRSEWQKINFNCHFQIPTIHGWIIDQLQGQITVNTLENIQADILGQDLKMKCLLALGKELRLKEPLSLDYVLTPAKFQTFFPQEAKTPFLLSPASLHLSIEPFAASLEGNLLKNFKTQITASIDALSLQYEQQMHTFKNLQFQCAFDAPNETLEGHLKTEGQPLELNVTARSLKLGRNLDFSKSHLNFSIKTDHFSLSILDGLIDTSHPLTTLFGPSLTLSVDGEASPKEQTFSISAKGKQLSIETSLLFKDNLLEIKKPLNMDWVLNEKGYALLDRWMTGQKESPFELQKPIHLHLNADQLSYAIKDKDLCISGNFLADNCNFIEKKSGHLVSLEHCKLVASRTSQNNPIQVDLKASINKQGKVLFKGELKDPFTGKIGGQIEKFPTLLLDVVARFFKRVDFPFSTFFGETLNAQISTDLKNFTGPIFLNVHSPNVRTSLTGSFENRVLTLKEPLHAQMLMTHKISSLFLKEVNPLSITSIESIHPVTLQIDHVGFSLPFSADWSKLKVPNAHIELGEIFCKNEGNIHLALSLLKQNQDPMPDLKLWFTPIDLHIDHQLCKVERTEILINNSLEICTFGEINLGKEDVNMILGLTSQCLHKAFGIENLPPDYVLQVPLKGALDNVKLDAKKATTKITTLLLWQKSGVKLGEIGGGAGAFIGELIGKLATLPDRDIESPPPKLPYPWDKNKIAKVKQPKTKKKNKIKKDEKPLKTLLKILT